MEQRKFQMPTAYTILFCLILLVALSTWFIPAGSYDYADGIPISGSYHAVAPAPQGIGAALKAAFRGFYDAVDVCVFILMVGGFLGVVMKTGAIDAGVSNVISRLQGRENLLITILMLFFGLGGTTYGMWEETMAFFPLLLPIFLAAGYDAVVGVAVILLGAGAGVIASTVNPFATGIAAGFAGVSLGEGLLWRLIQFVIFEGAAISRGMQAGPGAIHRVTYENGKISCRTIESAPAAGIWGSVLIDAAAVFLRAGIIDETGAFTDEEDAYSLAPEVSLTQKDIRMLQLAKSAICAGMLTLLEAGGLGAEGPARLVIAGGFGSFLDLHSAACIGLYPPTLESRARAIGNAALAGASMMLLRGQYRQQAAALAEQAETVDLSASPVFRENYVECMGFETP